MKKLLLLLAFSLLYALPSWSQGYTNGSITAVDTSATCSTSGGFVSVNVLQNSSSVAFTVSGTFSATLQFVGTVDGTSWVAVNAFPPNSTTAVTSTTSGGTWKADVANFSQFCVRASAYVSGAATVGMRNSSGVSTSTLTGGGGGGLAPSSPGIAANLNHVTISPNCLTGAPNCYLVAADAKFVTDATWSSGATVQVTIGASDPQFQCPGGVYPCSGGTPSATNDVGKTAWGTGNCAAVNPQQCTVYIPQGTISSITSGTVATLTSTASQSSSNGSGIRNFAWGTIDSTQASAAADACYNSLTTCEIDLPASAMLIDTSSFTPIRVTRTGAKEHPVTYKGAVSGTQILIPPTFNCTSSGAGHGCLLELSYQAGQVPGYSWSDYASDITFYGLGEDLPTAGQFTGTAYNLAVTGGYTASQNIQLIGIFWDFANTKTVYGVYCGGTCINDVAWAAGNYGLFATNQIQDAGSVFGGYFGNTAFNSCTVTNASGGNMVNFYGVACGFQVVGSSNTVGALNIPSTTSASFTFNDYGSQYWSTMFFSGGTANLYGSYEDPLAGGSTASLFVNNSAAKVNLKGFIYGVGANIFPWLALSAGTVTDNCGQVGSFTAANAATITGGTLIPCGGAGGWVGISAQLSGASACVASQTLFLFPYGQTATSTCSSATAETQIGGFVAPRAGTLQDLFFTAGTGGVAGDAVTVYKNGATTAITCTYGTGTSCQDSTTTHNVSVAAGDLIGFAITTGVADSTKTPYATLILY